MTVRRLRAGEMTLFKTLRLRALADSPAAFAHTHAEISAKPAAWWQEMARSLTEPGPHVMFVAEDVSTVEPIVADLVIGGIRELVTCDASVNHVRAIVKRGRLVYER
jgi:hypothetical protein